MKNITLHIYDENGENIVKMFEAQPKRIMFGTVRKLMELVKIEESKGQAELLIKVANAWDEVTEVLGKFFPDATDEDWNRTDLGEILRVIIDISKYAISQAFVIPTDEKN